MTQDPKDGKQQQQDSKGGKQQQVQSGEGNVYGEGNYKATRDYNEGVKDHMQHHDIEKEARDAAPRTPAEEKEMDEAERFARGKSRGEGGSADDAESGDIEK